MLYSPRVLLRSVAVGALAFALSTSSSIAVTSSSSSSGAAVVGSKVAGFSPWVGCDSITYAGTKTDVRVQCTKYTAPLCYTGVCQDPLSRTVEVNIKRAQATQGENSPNVWLLQGGAGTSSQALDEAIATLHVKLNGAVNVYTMDQRGSGKSSLFDCPSSMINGSIFHPTTAQCASDLESKYGSDFSAFSITSAATDVATFISTYQTNSKTFVYGVGYGSVLTERLLHLNTTEVIGYVLDAVKTTSGAEVSEFMYESKSAVDFGEITRRTFEFCVGTKECMAKFPSESLLDLIKRMTTNYSGYISSKCVDIMSTPENRQSSFALTFKSILADMYMNEQAVGLLAAFVYRVNRCTDQDFEVVSRFIYSVHPLLASRPFDESEYKASLLYKLITFSEMWETPTPSSETMMMRHTNASMSTGPMTSLVTSYCELTQENSTACAAETAPSYASPSIVYKRDQYWNKAATIPAHASVLVISSQPDAQAPQKYADRLYKALNGSNKAFFNSKYMTHGSLWWSPQNQFHQATTTIGMDTLIAYVQNNADLSKLTIAYGVGGVPSTVVITDEIESMQLFGVKDAFEGKLDDDASSSSKRTVVIVVVVVAALLVLAGAAFVLYHRRQANAKKQALMITEDEGLKEEARDTVSPSACTSYHYNAEQARV